MPPQFPLPKVLATSFSSLTMARFRRASAFFLEFKKPSATFFSILSSRHKLRILFSRRFPGNGLLALFLFDLMNFAHSPWASVHFSLPEACGFPFQPTLMSGTLQQETSLLTPQVGPPSPLLSGLSAMHIPFFPAPRLARPGPFSPPFCSPVVVMLFFFLPPLPSNWMATFSHVVSSLLPFSSSRCSFPCLPLQDGFLADSQLVPFFLCFFTIRLSPRLTARISHFKIVPPPRLISPLFLPDSFRSSNFSRRAVKDCRGLSPLIRKLPLVGWFLLASHIY